MTPPARAVFLFGGSMRRVEILALAGAMALALCLAGCTQADTVKAANAIHAYLPSVMVLAQDAATVIEGVDPSEAAKVKSVSAQVQNDLTELETVSGAYASSPSSDEWVRLGAVVDALVSDSDQGLMAAAEIKNPESQAKVKMAMSALDAAVHAVDGYLLTARTPEEAQAAVAKRTGK